MAGNRGWFSLLIINHSPPQPAPAPDLDTAVNTVNTNIISISWIRDPWINNGPINRSSIVIIESKLHNHQSKVSLELIVKIVFNTSLHIKSFQFYKSFKIKYSWPSFNILLLKIVIFVECPEAKFEGCLESGKYQHSVDRRDSEPRLHAEFRMFEWWHWSGFFSEVWSFSTPPHSECYKPVKVRFIRPSIWIYLFSSFSVRTVFYIFPPLADKQKM